MNKEIKWEEDWYEEEYEGDDDLIRIKDLSELKIGDRVMCDYVGGMGTYKNRGRKDREGIVIDIGSQMIGVEFDNNVHNGHNCGGMGKNGYCWYVGTDDNIRRI